VDIDLSVALRIGPSFDRVQDFVFHMGAERLDAYLSFQVEESIRGLVYDVTHDRVNDLRSEFAADMLSVLQAKVERFGIEIVNVKVTDVALPRELQARLESTTAFKTRLTEEAKNHEPQAASTVWIPGKAAPLETMRHKSVFHLHDSP